MFHLKNPFKKNERKILKIKSSNIVTLEYNIPSSMYKYDGSHITAPVYNPFDSSVVTNAEYNKQKQSIIFAIILLVLCFCFMIYSNIRLHNEINILKEQQNLYLKENCKNE